jgi:mRNA-degrading endonuclease RelE of RelBE toxin-antitoxin system
VLASKFRRPFDRTFKKLSRENQKRIQEAVDEILEVPQRNSKSAKAQWKGKLERRVGALRIMYSYCKKCREFKHQIFNRCPDCENTPDETAIFYDIIESHKF